MKKIIALLLLLSLIFPVSAYDKNFDQELEPIITEVTEELTDEDVLELYAEDNNLSVSEAKEILYNRNLIEKYAYGHIKRTRLYEFGKYKVEIGGIFKVQSSGSFRQIESCIKMWTKAVGSGNYRWNEAYIVDLTDSYPAFICTLDANGDFEVEISKSLASTIGAELLGFGFTVEEGTSTTYIYRKNVDLSLQYKIY